MYKTSDPALVTGELKSIAGFDQVEEPPDSRYAVAIWTGTDKNTGSCPKSVIEDKRFTINELCILRGKGFCLDGEKAASGSRCPACHA
jgi:hypothetical protein